MNNVNLVGNITADFKLFNAGERTAVASTSLAYNDSYKKPNGDKVETTSFFEIVAFGKLGEALAKYTAKGHKLGVTGRLQQRTWMDSETGKKRSSVQVVVTDFDFLQPKAA